MLASPWQVLNNLRQPDAWFHKQFRPLAWPLPPCEDFRGCARFRHEVAQLLRTCCGASEVQSNLAVLQPLRGLRRRPSGFHDVGASCVSVWRGSEEFLVLVVQGGLEVLFGSFYLTYTGDSATGSLTWHLCKTMLLDAPASLHQSPHFATGKVSKQTEPRGRLGLVFFILSHVVPSCAPLQPTS